MPQLTIRNQLTLLGLTAALGSSGLLLLEAKNCAVGADSSLMLLLNFVFPLYSTQSIPYHAEDALFLYSDALIETENTKSGLLTIPMLEPILPAKTPQLSFKNVIQKFKAHCDKGVDDDLTMVLLSRKLPNNVLK